MASRRKVPPKHPRAPSHAWRPDGVDSLWRLRDGCGVSSSQRCVGNRSDLSIGAAQRTRDRARRYGLAITPIVADIEHLPFRDRAINLVYVHDGLHHLEQPALGLAEMARVAAHSISITEPARSLATEIAIRFGIAQRVEDAGNRVERLDPAPIARVLRAHGFDIIHSERYAMYYRHHPGPIFAALSAPGMFSLARLG